MISSRLIDPPLIRNIAGVVFRRAMPADANELSLIAHRAKAYWGYCAQQMTLWRAELTFDAASITRHPVFVAIVDSRIAGFYQVQLGQPASTLDHLWVDPAFMRKGIGKALLYHASKLVTDAGAACLLIDSDPNAEPFYRLCGAFKTAELAAPIAGQPGRMRPQFSITLPSITLDSLIEIDTPRGFDYPG